MGLSISSTYIVLMVTQRTGSHDLQVRDVKTELLRNEATHKRHGVWGQKGEGMDAGGTFLSGSFSGFPLLSPAQPSPSPPRHLSLFSLQWLGREWVMAGADPSRCELLHLLWRCSLLVQPSNPYMTTGKTIALTRRAFVSKVMSLLFNTLSRLVIAFPPRRKCLKFTAAVTVCSDFGAQEKKSGHELGSLLSAHYTPLLATRNIATRATCRK